MIYPLFMFFFILIFSSIMIMFGYSSFFSNWIHKYNNYLFFLYLRNFGVLVKIYIFVFYNEYQKFLKIALILHGMSFFYVLLIRVLFLNTYIYKITYSPFKNFILIFCLFFCLCMVYLRFLVNLSLVLVNYTNALHLNCLKIFYI